MAASDANGVIKQSMKNTATHVFHTKSGYQSTSMTIEVVITNFYMLKKDVIYSKSLLFNDWKMNFVKTDKKVVVTLDNFRGCRYGVKCYVRYDKNAISRDVIAEEYEGTYIITLSSDIINDPRNIHLKCGYLGVILVIMSTFSDMRVRLVSESINLRKCQFILSMDEDKKQIGEEVLMNDIAAVFCDPNFSDFRIKARDYTAPVSKSIIASRSKFFFNYLEKHPDSEELEIDTSGEALKMVLKYIYCGRLFVESTLTMQEVMILAKKLKMKKLFKLCKNFKNSIGDSYKFSSKDCE